MTLDLQRVARLQLCHLPTPLEPLRRLTDELGGPRIFVKRDDCTGLAVGGNKARKLEFLLADALEQGADTIITVGGTQSNHARQTAAACARLGLDCELILPRMSRFHSPTYDTGGNVLLDQLLGARLHHLPGPDDAAPAIRELQQELRAAGRKPYFIPAGGSTPLGAVGYVAAAEELLGQLRDRELPIDTVVVTTGSCTTHAGLLTGLAALDSSIRLIGITIFREADDAAALVREKAQQTADLIGLPRTQADDRVEVRGEYLGDGYGEPTDRMREAVQLVARLEGLLLDPVYTGKTMSALIDLARRGELTADQNVLFWHTGGTPALFPYADALL